jgi:polysaccharide export outer membrane protein
MFRALLALSIAWPACLPAGAQDLKPGADAAHRISPGDTLSIEVFPAKEYSRDVVVQPDGNLEMAMIGQVNAQSMTTSQLAELLTLKLSKYVAKPQVNVGIRTFASRVVTIAGEVNQAGTYDYKDGMRVLDMLLKGGGPKDNARLSRIKVFRKEGDAVRRFNVDFERFIDGDFSDNIPLRPMDMVYVPTKPVTKTARWLSDNFVPWATLFTFAATLVVLARNR